ncbi:MAG: glycosyltransferase [Bacteriovoracaceae bacterium]|nr:glycosyltransferase [Bacteriovoracaceae bacterium]
MKERVHVNDLTTLFICPTKKWRTLERKAIADCLYLRDCGGNPILFCVKGTYVDREAEKRDLPRIYYTGQKLDRLFDLRYIRDMRKILNENRFDIVHCYNLDFIWGLCFVLMSNPKVPLLLTFNRFLNFTQKSLWQRWLFRRVDLVITFSQTTKEIAQETLPVSFRKIKIAGGGIDVIPKAIREEKLTKRLGSIISGSDDVDRVKVVMYALQSLLSSTIDLGIKLEFAVFSSFDQDSDELVPLQELVSQLGLTEVVSYKPLFSGESTFKEVDIFVGTSFGEPFNDFEIMALLSHVPVIFPRTASRQSILLQYKWVGESYYFEDARELKAKLLKLLINEQVYLNELQDSHEQIKELHGIEAYAERVSGFYERLYAKRLRYIRHKEKLNYS